MIETTKCFCKLLWIRASAQCHKKKCKCKGGIKARIMSEIHVYHNDLVSQAKAKGKKRRKMCLPLLVWQCSGLVCVVFKMLLAGNMDETCEPWFMILP